MKKGFIKKLAPSIQEIGTLKNTRIQKTKHKEIISDYQKGFTLEDIGKKYNCHFVTIFYILKKYKIDMSKHGSGEKYSFPESDYVQKLMKDGFKEKEFIPLIASLLFTDGCLYKTKKGSYEISYYGTDKTLHNIFADLIWSYFKIRPSSYMIRCGRVLRTKYIDRKIAEKLLKLSKTYKTKLSIDENCTSFLKDNNPSLSFIEYYNVKVIKEMVRLAMCADGCIAVSRRNDNIFFTLILSCAHPSLANEWHNLFKISGIKSSIVKSNGKVAGVKGIEDCISKFLHIGGFVKGVRVCVKKSPLYGIEKQKILLLAEKLLKEHNRINTAPIKFEKFKKLLQYF